MVSVCLERGLVKEERKLVEVTEFFSEPLGMQVEEHRLSSFALRNCKDLITTVPGKGKVISAKDYEEVKRRYREYIAGNKGKEV